MSKLIPKSTKKKDIKGSSPISPNPLHSKTLNFQYYILGNSQLAITMLLTRLNRLAKSICRLLGVSRIIPTERPLNLFELTRLIIGSFRNVQICLRTRYNGKTQLECNNRSADVDNSRHTAVIEPVVSFKRFVDSDTSQLTAVIDPYTSGTMGNIKEFTSVMAELRKDYVLTKSQLERVRTNILLGTMPVTDYLTMVYQEHRLPGFLYDHLDSKAKLQLRQSDVLLDSDNPPFHVRSDEYGTWNKTFLQALKDRKKFILSEVAAGRQNMAPVYLYAFLWAKDYIGEFVDQAEIVESAQIDNFVKQLSNL